MFFFFLTLGADPIPQLQALSVEYGRKIAITTLGLPPSRSILKSSIEEAIDFGSWVIVDEVHRDLPQLTNTTFLVTNSDPTRTHDNFRLWLIVRPDGETKLSNYILASCFIIHLQPIDLESLLKSEFHKENLASVWFPPTLLPKSAPKEVKRESPVKRKLSGKSISSSLQIDHAKENGQEQYSKLSILLHTLLLLRQKIPHTHIPLLWIFGDVTVRESAQLLNDLALCIERERTLAMSMRKPLSEETKQHSTESHSHSLMNLNPLNRHNSLKSTKGSKLREMIGNHIGSSENLELSVPHGTIVKSLQTAIYSGYLEDDHWFGYLEELLRLVADHAWLESCINLGISTIGNKWPYSIFQTTAINQWIATGKSWIQQMRVLLLKAKQVASTNEINESSQSGYWISSKQKRANASKMSQESTENDQDDIFNDIDQVQVEENCIEDEARTINQTSDFFAQLDEISSHNQVSPAGFSENASMLPSTIDILLKIDNFCSPIPWTKSVSEVASNLEFSFSSAQRLIEQIYELESVIEDLLERYIYCTAQSKQNGQWWLWWLRAENEFLRHTLSVFRKDLSQICRAIRGELSLNLHILYAILTRSSLSSWLPDSICPKSCIPSLPMCRRQVCDTNDKIISWATVLEKLQSWLSCIRDLVVEYQKVTEMPQSQDVCLLPTIIPSIQFGAVALPATACFAMKIYGSQYIRIPLHRTKLNLVWSSDYFHEAEALPPLSPSRPVKVASLSGNLMFVGATLKKLQSKSSKKEENILAFPPGSQKNQSIMKREFSVPKSSLWMLSEVIPCQLINEKDSLVFVVTEHVGERITSRKSKRINVPLFHCNKNPFPASNGFAIGNSVSGAIEMPRSEPIVCLYSKYDLSDAWLLTDHAVSLYLCNN